MKVINAVIIAFVYNKRCKFDFLYGQSDIDMIKYIKRGVIL